MLPCACRTVPKALALPLLGFGPPSPDLHPGLCPPSAVSPLVFLLLQPTDSQRCTWACSRSCCDLVRTTYVFFMAGPGGSSSGPSPAPSRWGWKEGGPDLPHVPCWLCCGSDSSKGVVLSYPVSSPSTINSEIITAQMHYLIFKPEIVNWLLPYPAEQPSEGTQRFVGTSLARFLGSSGCGAAEAKHPVNLPTKALRLKFVEITQRLKLNRRLNLCGLSAQMI